MGHRIAIAENYPHLKADQNFRDLKNQLASPPTHVTNWSTDHCRHSIRTSDRRHLRGIAKCGPSLRRSVMPVPATTPTSCRTR